MVIPHDMYMAVIIVIKLAVNFCIIDQRGKLESNKQDLVGHWNERHISADP